jgi:CheY-like chemotaxis protein
MERIFDPFFTTKGREGGTGMGLSVAHGIVRSHHGEITLESQPGEGSTFRVFLPLVEKEAAATDSKDPSPLPTGDESILFVDDEASIVHIGEQTLGYLGYNMVCMTSSTEALDAFRAGPDRFDLVITDLTMPDMTGVELAENILEIRSEIPIILCTGFSEAVTSEDARKMGISGFLKKPVTIRELAESVRRVLDAR